jgi:DNA-binding CsgD family transcriptional regulator
LKRRPAPELIVTLWMMTHARGGISGTALRDVVQAVCDDNGIERCVALEGEPGIGKSTVLQTIAKEISAESAVLLCTARPSDRLHPFAPLSKALDRLRKSGSMPPEPEELLDAVLSRRIQSSRYSPLQVMPDERVRLTEGLASVIASWSELAPVVVMLDDAQWADDATLAVLEQLLDMAEETQVSVVVALRPLPRRNPLVDFLEHSRALGHSVTKLAPLPEGDATALIEELVGGTPGPRLLEAAECAGGNPFLLTQFVEFLLREQHLQDLSGTTELEPDFPGVGDATDVHDAVLARMARFNDDGMRVLRIAAALRGSFTIADLAQASSLSTSVVLPTVEQAVRQGVLQDDNRRLRFQHDLVSEAILGPLTPAMQAALHREIAAGLTRADAPPATVAAHLVQGADHGDIRAVETIVDAALPLVHTAPAAAAELLSKALELAPTTYGPRDEITAELVDASFWCGQLQEAMALAEELLTRPITPELRGRTHDTMARALALTGRPAEAIAHAEAIGDAEERRAWALALTAFFRLFSMDLEGALGDARRAVEESDGDEWAETLGWSVACFAQITRGYHLSACDLGDAAVRSGDRSQDLEAHQLAPLLFYGIALENASRGEQAHAVLRRGRLISHELGTSWSTPFFHYATALQHWGAGEWDDLLAETSAGLRFARQHDVMLVAGFACAVSAGAHLLQSRPDDAVALLDEGDALLARGGLQYGADWLAWVRALHFEQVGSHVEALGLLRSGLEFAQGMNAGAALSLFGPDLVRMAMIAGDSSAAIECLERIEERDEAADRSNVDAHVLRARGLFELDADRIGRARDAHLEYSRPVEVLFDDEAALLCAAISGQSAEARRMLTSLTMRCDELGCPGLAQRAARAAQRFGVKVGQQRDPRPVTGWDSLTKTERTVALLVAQGLSNIGVAEQLSVSPRTVESHLYRTFMKLSVENRTELAVAATQLQSSKSANN